MMKAVVTGHTRGLGAAIAAKLLARGIAVLGLARGSNTGLAAQFPATLEQVALDLSDSGRLERWLAGDALRGFLADAHTVLLINNAGTFGPVGPDDTLAPAAIARSVSLNLAAPLMLTSAVGAASMHAAERRILHVSSGAARTPYPGWSVYCATKAGLDHHARSSALERTGHLRICSLAPGVVDTDMQAELRACPLEHFPLRQKFDEFKRAGALLDPADCAQRLLDYLLDEQFGQAAVADLRQLA